MRLGQSQGVGGARVVEPGAPQGLVGVDVADAGHEALVEQRALDPGPTTAHRPCEVVAPQRGVEQVARDVRGGLGDLREGRPPASGRTVGGRCEVRHGQVPERALVHEVEGARRVRLVLAGEPRQLEPDPQVRHLLDRGVP
ncbi:hypothetical protein D3C74_389150 [compost metagenome]